MTITDIIPNIIGTDLWVATYRKDAMSHFVVQFIKFNRIDDDGTVWLDYIVEAELLRHARYTEDHDWLIHKGSWIYSEYIDNFYELVEPVEIYTYDDLIEWGISVAEEDR